MKVLFMLIAIALLTACRGLPPERLAGMDKMELCKRIATYEYKGQPEYFLATAQEIERRGFDDAECMTTRELMFNRFGYQNYRRAVSISVLAALNQ